MRSYTQYYSHQWRFSDMKDKGGNPPTKEIWDFIQKLERNALLPCPRSADELEMPLASTTTPREMNSFIVFRRQLAHVAKQKKSSEDGRVLSRAASFIWNSASKEEKDSYSRVAKELKKRHYERYPDYSYERKRKLPNDGGYIFVPHDATNTTNNNSRRPKKPILQTCDESSHIQQEYASSSTPLQQDKGNEENILNLQNSFTYDCSSVDPVLYSNFEVNDNECFPLSDEAIAQVYYQSMSTNMPMQIPMQMPVQMQMPQELLSPEELLSQELLPQQQQEYLSLETLLNGDSDAGMNQNSNEALYSLFRQINEVIPNQPNQL